MLKRLMRHHPTPAFKLVNAKAGLPMRYYLACRFLSNLLNSKYDYGNFKETHLFAALLARACLYVRGFRTAYLYPRREP